MEIKELEEYRKFTTPAELHKAVNTLKGIVAGITTDLATNASEVQELANWCVLHQNLRKRHPFNELIPLVEAAYQDGVLDTEEAKDIVWLCNNFISDADYYDLITSSVQFLFGLLHGIMADGVLSDDEIKSLRKWLDANDYLRGIYPFDELESLLISVLADGKIDDTERDMLQAFFSNFIDFTKSYNLNECQMSALREKHNVSGVCSICPDIKFSGSLFCFTGQSFRSDRKGLAATVQGLGGKFGNTVTQKTDYLVVGTAGNPCWAYACYGRKIEEAVELRRNGHKLIIVNELDFWDSVEDARVDLD